MRQSESQWVSQLDSSLDSQSTRNQLTAANSNNIIHYFKLVSQHCIDYSRVCTCVTCSEQWLVRCDTPQAPPCEPGAVGIRGSRPEATHSPSNRGIENDTPRDFRRPVNSKETIQKGRFITKRWHMSWRKGNPLKRFWNPFLLPKMWIYQVVPQLNSPHDAAL